MRLLIAMSDARGKHREWQERRQCPSLKKSRDMICNLRFFHWEGNYICLDYPNEADKAGRGAKKTQNGERFCAFTGLEANFLGKERAVRISKEL